MIHYEALNQQPISLFLYDFYAYFDRWYLRMNIKYSTQYFPCQIWRITRRNTAILLISEYFHSAPQITHKYKGVVYIIVLRPFYILTFSHSAFKALSQPQLSRKSGISFHTYTKKDSTTYVSFCTWSAIFFLATRPAGCPGAVWKLLPRIKQKANPVNTK